VSSKRSRDTAICSTLSPSAFYKEEKKKKNLKHQSINQSIKSIDRISSFSSFSIWLPKY
jgi:hypothetical protein